MPELQLDGDSLNITSKIKIFGKETVLTQNQHNQEQFNVIASEYIDATLRPRAVALDTVSNRKIYGKNFTDLSLDICLGITEKLANTNRKVFLKTQGTIVDSGLTGGSLNQPVYLNASGFLSLTPSICKVGYLIKTTTPTVYLNIGTESSNVDLTIAFDAIPKSYLANPDLLTAFEKFKRDFEMDFSVSTAQTFTKIASNGTNTLVAITDVVQAIKYSTDDGATWNTATLPGDISANFWSNVIFLNGNFIALCSSLVATPTKRIAVSADGITWVGKMTDTSSLILNGFADDGAGNYTALGESGDRAVIYYSTNKFDWTSNPVPSDQFMSALTYGAGKFVGVAYAGTNRVVNSTNGTSWTEHSASQANSWMGVAFGASTFVAVASDGVNRVMTSPDGINWTNQTASQANSWRGIAFGAGLFVAVAPDGANRVMTSPDGINWTNQTASSVDSWVSIAYSSTLSLFVAISSSGTNVMTSPDGITWTDQPISSGAWDFVYWDAQRLVFIAYRTVGAYKFMVSTDGIIWNQITSASEVYDLIYDGVKYVAIAPTPFSKFKTSTDLNTWQTLPEDPVFFNQFPPSIDYGSGLYVTGFYNQLYTSPDLITWTLRAHPHDADVIYFVNMIRFINSKFYILGTNNETLESSNGTTWTKTKIIINAKEMINLGNNNILIFDNNMYIVDFTITESFSYLYSAKGAAFQNGYIYMVTGSLLYKVKFNVI